MGELFSGTIVEERAEKSAKKIKYRVDHQGTEHEALLFRKRNHSGNGTTQRNESING